MRARLVSVTVLFSALILIITGVLHFSEKNINSTDHKAEQIIALNEIQHLAQSGETEKAAEKINRLQEKLLRDQQLENGSNKLFAMCGSCILFLLITFGYVYFAILRPFEKMKTFARKIAQGNFDIPLQYERSNYFGAFTWAFDSMRREITKSRACEREAIENNKTVIATLSHDIKTPIASIRAYAEGLEANMDSSPEKRARYLSVIMKKCDEVSHLTNDLFLHSLSDLDKLKMNPERLEICGFIKNTIAEISAEQNDLHFIPPYFSATVSADKNRLTQIVENLINNARKYARSEIEIFLKQSDGNAEIHFRDHGTGIPDKDMPFIFDKFYRGKNCGSEQGSGLGLYIVKYITEQMNGKILLHNHSDGLEAIVTLPIISENT